MSSSPSSPSAPATSAPAISPAVYTFPKHHYLNNGTTVRSWLLTLDHKRIALLYLSVVLVSFLLGGIFAMVIRLELLTPGPTIIEALTYNRMFTLHGVVMIFLFMIPAIPAVFGNFFLPIMIGAKDVAFPRWNLVSFYLYLFGAILAVWGMVNGGTDTGWTFYTPYSTTTANGVLPVLLGVFVIGFSSILTGLNFIVTIHTLRARASPGSSSRSSSGPSTAPPSSRCWPRRSSAWWHSCCARRARSASVSSTRRAAGTRCSSSTSSGFTATRRSTSWCSRRWASSPRPSAPTAERIFLATG